MKKLMFLIVCIGTITCSRAQDTLVQTSQAPLTKEDYLRKNKTQRTNGIILISAGGAVTLAGLAIAINDVGNGIEDNFANGLNQTFNTDAPVAKSQKHTALSVLLIVAGAAGIAASIASFSSAHKSKRMAVSLSFQDELIPQFYKRLVFSRPAPSLALKIRL